MTQASGRILVLGGDGRVGARIVRLARARGYRVRAQVRPPGGAWTCPADPTDFAAIARLVEGCDAVLYALGYRGRRGEVDFFSRTTRTLLAAMNARGVRRLIAITGVGAGETRGHGGVLYDRVIFPLFTRPLYADKERQEELIRQSGLEWTIVRPAPFSRRAGQGPLRVLTVVGRGDVLRRIRPDDVAQFMVDELERRRHIGQAVFIGWP